MADWEMADWEMADLGVVMQLGPKAVRLWRRVPVEWFNLICRNIALIWLAVTISAGIVWRPTWPDFTQFYTGGLVARLGAWDALYPIPIPESQDNPGLKAHSDAKPLWLELQGQRQVKDSTHFILPPPSALLFIPLSLVGHETAFWIWVGILVACTWGVALLAGGSYRAILGRPSRWEGVLILLVAISPMVARAIRIMNVTPPVALCIGIAVFGLLRDRARSSALAIALGALLKYATLILLPLYVAARRWRALAWMAGLGVGVLVLSLTVMGTGPFGEFAGTIAPTLSRPSLFPGNQSLMGMLARASSRPVPTSIAIPLAVARISLLLAILGMIFRMRPQDWRSPVPVFAAAAMLLSWMLVFSPITWEHYPIFLCPVWGWMLWEVWQPGWRRVASVLALGLMNTPIAIISVRGFFTHPIFLPEPFNSSQMWGMLLTMFLAMSRLAERHGRRIGRSAAARARIPMVDAAGGQGN